MGRVEEAMRRAAEASPLDPETQPDTSASAATAVDFFPEEGTTPLTEEPEAPLPAPPASSAFADTGSLFERIDAAMAEKIVIDEQTMPSSREQYRRLAATLHHAQTASGIKVVMIASAVAGEGKTLTAANLALTLSESYQRDVLLIDGDLRRPSQHAIFKLEPAPGLADGLLTVKEPRLPLHQVSRHLTVLTAGRPTADPMAGLTSERMHRLIQEAREIFDWIIIDTPPVGLLTDANLLAAMADAALLVIKAGATPYNLVQRAADTIGRDRLLGTVLNQAEPAAVHAHYDYGYYYGSRRPRALDS